MILLKLNLLIILGFLFSLLFKKLKNYKSVVRLNYVLLALVFLLPMAFSLLPEPEYREAPVQVWSPGIREKNPVVTVSLPARTENSTFRPSSTIPDVIFIFTVLAVSIMTFVMIHDLRKIKKIFRQTFQIKKMGSVYILGSEVINSPFSLRLLNRKYVVLPTWILRSHRDYKISVLHELEHHRAGDTTVAYVLYFLKAFFYYNPFIHFWIQGLHHLQELSCDEAVVGQKRVSLQDYRHCLWKVMAQPSENILVGTAGMASDFKTLRRRFMSLNERKNPKRYTLFASVVVTLFVAVSYASYNSIQDRRISMSEAQEMAKNIRSDVPVTVNKFVVAELNNYLGTEKGRAWVRKAFSLLPNYKDQLEKQFAEYNFPKEMLAVPFAESGYDNDVASSARAAGIWQFIPETARRYDLRVDNTIDERLNVRLETVAGIRYLQDNKTLFNDWLLALIAYNMGERNLQKSIEKYGTRDAWKLVELGIKTDRGYLARVIAAIIILNNPEIAQKI